MLEQESNVGWETIAYASRFLNKAEEKYSINELELLGVVWALEHFKHYLYGHYFTVQTDHRALLSILKERSTKAHQSRLTRWCDSLIPFHFQIEHIPGSKMGLTDYISRNPNNKAKPISRYDEDFVIAQIDAINICKPIIFIDANHICNKTTREATKNRQAGIVQRFQSTYYKAKN